MIYNSQWVNNDPEPIRVMPDTRLEYRTANCVTKIPYETEFLYEPRPEYDNNPNPILLEHRSHNIPEHTRVLVWKMQRISLEWRVEDHNTGLVQYTDESLAQIKHALKVLEKLVRVYGEGNDIQGGNNE